jgi:hypothetical protein
MYSKYLYSLTTDFNNLLAGVLNLVNTSKAVMATVRGVQLYDEDILLMNTAGK